MKLDDQFGPVIPPQGYGGRQAVLPWEGSYSPKSLSRLDSLTALPLKSFMDAVYGGWELGEVWVNDTIVLWLVDKEGVIWFAIEELVLDEIPLNLPKHQTMALTKNCPKLGHPSLVGGQGARIGGEIYFDRTTSPASWVINNRSGRYGLHATRTRSQLQAVSQSFSSHGIDLVVDFI